MKHTPATPLPWETTNDYGLIASDLEIPEHATADHPADARYIAHVANAYPKLVERTERAAMTVFDPAQFPDAGAESLAQIKRGWDAAMNTVWERNIALLRDLGESE